LRLPINTHFNKVSSGGNSVLLSSDHRSHRPEDNYTNTMPRGKTTILPSAFRAGASVVKAAASAIKVGHTDSGALIRSALGVDYHYRDASFRGARGFVVCFRKRFLATRWSNRRRGHRRRGPNASLTRRLLCLCFSFLFRFYRGSLLSRLGSRIGRFLLIVNRLLLVRSLRLAFRLRRYWIGRGCDAGYLFALRSVTTRPSQNKERRRAKR
jgi:hypothetical protein